MRDRLVIALLAASFGSNLIRVSPVQPGSADAGTAD
jgi:hypothetical protein